MVREGGVRRVGGELFGAGDRREGGRRHRLPALSAALHSGDPTLDPLPAYFAEHLGPALGSLLDTAVAAGEIRAGIDPVDLLYAVANPSVPEPNDDGGPAQVMVGLLIDGLRYGAGAP